MMRQRKHVSLRKRNSITGYIFLSPWLVGLFVVFLVPLFSSVAFSLCELTIKDGYELDFIGFRNFVFAMTKDANFPKYLSQTLLELFYNVPVLLVFSFFVALLLKQKFRGNMLAKVVFFIPVIMSSGLFLKLQNNFGGITTSSLDSTLSEAASTVSVLKGLNLSSYLLQLGVPTTMVSFLTAPVNRVYDVVTSSGIQIFIFLSALNAVPSSLYEAAYVEGATGWESFWKITFPMVMPMILVNVVYSIINTFTSVNNKVMEYITMLSYQRFDFGLASAMGWIYCLILAVILGIIFGIFSRRTFYYT